MPTLSVVSFFSRLSAVAAEDAEVRIRVTLANAALVFLKGDIELPMQTVLDAPVAAHRVGETTGRDELAQDVVAVFTDSPFHRAECSLMATPIAFRPVQRERSGKSSGTGQIM